MWKLWQEVMEGLSDAEERHPSSAVSGRMKAGEDEEVL